MAGANSRSRNGHGLNTTNQATSTKTVGTCEGRLRTCGSSITSACKQPSGRLCRDGTPVTNSRPRAKPPSRPSRSSESAVDRFADDSSHRGILERIAGRSLHLAGRKWFQSRKLCSGVGEVILDFDPARGACRASSHDAIREQARDPSFPATRNGTKSARVRKPRIMPRNRMT